MKRIVCKLFSFGFMAMPLNSGAAESPDLKKLDADISAIVSDATHPLASLSVLAMKDGKVVYHRQFGYRTIDANNAAKNRPADANTMYRIASISKLIVTLGVMKLVEDGKLTLDTDVSQYLGFKLRNQHFPDDAITLRMLLNHTSSLRDDGGYYWDAKLGVGFADVLVPGSKLYGDGKMWAKNAKPGAYFQYANLPWGVVGMAMERVTGERFDRLMRRLILDPMNLKGGFHPADFSKDDLSNVATLYRKRTGDDGREVWNPKGPWVAQVDDYLAAPPTPRALPNYVIGTNGSLFGPMGNCRLTAEGLGKVMLMLINFGAHDGQQILKRDSVEQILSVQWRHDGMGLNGNSNGEVGFGTHRDLMNVWGLGVQHFQDISGPNRGDRLVEGGGFKASGHLGDAYGLTSAMVFDRKTKNGLIFMTGGPGFDPETYVGKYSSFYRHEEQILTALHRHAITLGK